MPEPKTNSTAIAGSSPVPDSPSFADLLESLDEWIDDALKNSKPIGLTLSRARVTITDQYDRIGELLDALEHQKAIARSRIEALKDHCREVNPTWAWLMREVLEIVDPQSPEPDDEGDPRTPSYGVAR